MTLEGGEGVGKSTQLRVLADLLAQEGERVVATREPGGSAAAEALRPLLVQGAVDRWSPTSELFLLMAARADHLDRTIRPALAEGAWVLCDRYWDSTRAYQGLVGGLDLGAIDALHEAWLAPFRPGLTLLFDLPVNAGLGRAVAGRFEARGPAFHEQVRRAYLKLAQAETERVHVIDAEGTPAAVAARVAAALVEYRARASLS